MHIVAIGPREYGVYRDYNSPGKYGEYDGKPVFKGTLEECEDNVRGCSYVLRAQTSIVPPWYIADAEKRADKYRKYIEDLGWTVESNATFRASAAWKEHPTHYAYFGDFGGMAQLVQRAASNPDMKDFDVAKGWLRELYGMASALWELGLVLTFDKDGKHTIYGNHPQWVTLDKED